MDSRRGVRSAVAAPFSPFTLRLRRDSTVLYNAALLFPTSPLLRSGAAGDERVFACPRVNHD